jgi:glyceraldehyde 3-phosphate dehydrogenase
MKVAINGLGRIGRAVLKIALDKGISIVAINDLADTKTLAYLMKYDSVYGIYDKRVEFGENFLKIDGKKILVLAEPNPEKLPWKRLGVDLVVECTGFFTRKEDMEKHISAGAKRVLLSAPAKDEPDLTVVFGVNENKLKKNHHIISVASCTTNCLAPLVKVLNDCFEIKKGFMTTVHGYTSSQNLVDGPHKKLRRGRAAADNLVPTTSGATTATVRVIPELKGKLDGLAIRVPVVCGSIVDFVCEIKKKTSVEEVNNAFKNASKGKMKGVLDYTEEEIVSNDIIKNSCSSIVDGLSTQVMGNMVKVLSWYDNEWGYSNRMVDLIKFIGKL